jgi:membrane associated rhomboid family serine protease
MGIHDREYHRSPAEPPAYRRAAGWSATTWIIAVCVAVFVIDGFLGWTLEPVRSTPVPGASERSRAPAERVVLTQPVPQGPGMAVGMAMVEGVGPVAEVEYRVERRLWSLGYFSTSRAIWGSDPVLGSTGLELWRFVTFQFLHDTSTLNHILFNMLTLYFFGGMVENYLGRKRYAAFYLLCGVSGALMYLLLNGLATAGQSAFGPGFRLPGLLFNDPTTPLVGASAGVFGVIMAAAFLAPNARVLLFFVIPMRLATLAYGLLAFALLAVVFGWTNAGGEAAHIGGALAGFWLVRNPGHLHGFFDFLGQYDPTSRVARARVAVRRGTASGDAAEVNRILDKISARGLHSLTEAEKRTLREASRKQR